MPRNEISNSDDVIDSRDVIERIEELQGARDSLLEDIEEAREAFRALPKDKADPEYSREDHELSADGIQAKEDALTVWDVDNGDELKALLNLQEEAEGYAPDWRHGATMIRDSYFTDYCEELVKDIGDLPKDIPSYLVIDWDATAENLKVDYTEVDFDGVAYWIR